MAGHVELSKQFDLDTVITLKEPNAILNSATTLIGTPYLSLAKSHFIAFIVTAIDVNLAGAITAWVLEATAAAAGLKTATPLKTASWSAGTPEGGVAKVLEVAASELDVANGYSFVALKIKLAGADSVAVSIIRGPNRYEPAGDYI